MPTKWKLLVSRFIVKFFYLTFFCCKIKIADKLSRMRPQYTYMKMMIDGTGNHYTYFHLIYIYFSPTWTLFNQMTHWRYIEKRKTPIGVKLLKIVHIKSVQVTYWKYVGNPLEAEVK